MLNISILCNPKTASCVKHKAICITECLIRKGLIHGTVGEKKWPIYRFVVVVVMLLLFIHQIGKKKDREGFILLIILSFAFFLIHYHRNFQVTFRTWNSLPVPYNTSWVYHQKTHTPTLWLSKIVIISIFAL